MSRPSPPRPLSGSGCAAWKATHKAPLVQAGKTIDVRQDNHLTGSQRGAGIGAERGGPRFLRFFTVRSCLQPGRCLNWRGVDWIPDTWYRDHMGGIGNPAWSTLRALLAENNLTVADLHEKLREQGFDVNKKSLYRLTTAHPVQKIDTAIARAICEALDVGLGDLIQFQRPKFELQRLDPKSEKELDRLMAKNNEGKLTEKERARFQTLLDEVQKITLYNSKMLVDQKRLRESKSAKVAVAR